MLKANAHLATLAIAVLFLSLVGVFGRILEPTNGYMATLFGYAAVVVLSLVWALSRGKISSLAPRENKLNLVILALGQLGSAAFFMQAINFIDLAVAALLLYSAPLWVVLLCFLFNEDKPRRVILLPFILGMAGLVLVTQPIAIMQVSSLNIGLLLGALSGISYAISFVFARKVKNSYDTPTIVFWNHMIGTIILLPLLAVFPFRVDITAIGAYTGIGLSWLLGYILLYHSLRFVQATLASLTALLEPVFVATWGLVLFNEVPPLLTILGGAILIANVYAINRIMQGQESEAVYSNHPN